MLELALIDSPEQLSESYPVMLQLRPHLSESDFVNQVQAQQVDGYKLLGASRDNAFVGLAGFVISHKLAWGKHLYVDDLVTVDTRRSSGVGQAMLQWLGAYALEQGCEQLHLDSGVQRFAAHRFYLRHGFDITSHHFAKTLP